MYPVSAAYLEQIRADERRVYGRAVVDFTAPFADQSIQATANELANVSYPGQTADGLTETSYKYASLDGTTILDGTYHPAPSAVEAATVQMGWWGSQLAQADGTFVSPFPTLIITHAARPIWSLSVTGDSKRGEWPVDWFIRLYDAANTLLHTETVTGNTSMTWAKEITSVLDVVRQELEIRRWSHAGRQAKILEFFTSIQETYDGEQITAMSLLEESDFAQASLPVGNISANELGLRLQNIDRRFDAGNPTSPLRGLLKPNRRVRAWLGVADSVTVQDDVTAGTLDNVVALPDGRLELGSVPGPTFSRASDAYRTDGSLVPPEMPRFEAGKFWSGVMVEEGTTNLLSAARSSNFSIWPKDNVTTPNDSTVIEDTAYGIHRIRTEVSGVVGQQSTMSVFAKDNGRRYVYLNANTFMGARACIDLQTGAVVTDGGTANVIALADGWYRISITGTILISSSTAYIQLNNSFVPTDTGYTGDGVSGIYLSRGQLEQRAYATSWHLGGATRSPETLTTPTPGVLNPQEGTVEFWYYPITGLGAINRHLFNSTAAGDLVRLGCWVNVNTKVIGIMVGTGSASQAFFGTTVLAEGNNYSIAITWDSTNVKVYLNGTVEINTGVSPGFDFGTVAFIGRWHGGTGWECNGLIDDLRISSRARTDAEIAAAYASGEPLPVDEDTTYLLRFDGHLPTRIYRPAGQRVSPVYDISSTARPLSILVNWQESIPAGTSVIMEANVSTDGGTTWGGWQTVLNGGALLVSDLTNARLQLRQTFATNADMTATAGIEDTAITVTLDQAGEMVPLGTFWTGDWHTDEREGYVKTTARDRMELLRTSTYSASQVAVNTTLYSLAVAILQNAGLTATEYTVDTELQQFAIPYAWFDPQSHREALRKIAEACLGQAYCDRYSKVVVDGPSALARQGAFLLPSFPALVASENITADSYFGRSQPLRWGEVANYIEVDTQPLRPDVVTEVHRSNEPVPIAAGQTLTLTVYYTHVPSIEAVASLFDAPTGATITAATYYAWGADVTVNSPAAGTFILVINAKPMKILNKERAIAQDDASIREHGTLKYTFPGNPLVQSLIMAQRIADTLLRFYRDPRRDVEVDWRGNPALTLGDVVVVPDFDARHHYYVVRQTLDYTGGLTSQLTGRKV